MNGHWCSMRTTRPGSTVPSRDLCAVAVRRLAACTAIACMTAAMP